MTTELDLLKENDFQGFVTVKELRENIRIVPNYGGVYVVLRPKDDKPVFLEEGTGGFFKGKDPNVPISQLEAKWIADSSVLYIGKAGKTANRGLRKRLYEYMRFGQGEPVGHYGGRYIWQLADAADLLVCWKRIDGDPEQAERQLLLAFKEEYGDFPFANLRL